MDIRFYLRLLLVALLAVPVILLLVIGVDAPLANLLHEHGAPLRSFFAGLMQLHDVVMNVLVLNSYIPWTCAGLLGLFVATRLLRWPNSTIWLIVPLTYIASMLGHSLLIHYFNRPRPYEVFGHLAPDAGFWQGAEFNAFPSGHASGAAGLLLPWALRFPEARPWLLAWLGLVCLGRVVLEYHWLSDVVAGAALGLLLTCAAEVGTWWLRPKPVDADKNRLSS